MTCWCGSGYICPAGTGPLTAANQCDVPTLYCPAGALFQLFVGVGYYALATRQGYYYDKAPCPVGSYCLGGVARPCPSGTFGNASLLTSSDCSGQCSAGYYCLPGSTSSTAAACSTSAGFYCPAVRPTLCVNGVIRRSGCCTCVTPATLVAALPSSYCQS